MGLKIKDIKFPLVVNDDLLLRTFVKSDAQSFLDAVDEDRTYLATKVPWVDHRKTIDDVLGYFSRLEERILSNQGFCIGIFYHQQFAGEMKVHEISWPHKKTEIGCWLRKKYRGNNIATLATLEITKVLFENLKLNRVYLTCSHDNFESQKIPEKIGFIKEGILRKDCIQNGVAKDSIMYALTDRDWDSIKDKQGYE